MSRKCAAHKGVYRLRKNLENQRVPEKNKNRSDCEVRAIFCSAKLQYACRDDAKTGRYTWAFKISTILRSTCAVKPQMMCSLYS